MFKVGDIVDAKFSEVSGVVTHVWFHGIIEKVNVQTSPVTPPVNFYASELKAHVLASPDTVLIKDEHGRLWGLEVADITADGTQFYFSHDGKLWMLPVARIVQVIPAKLALAYQTLYRGA